MRLPIVTSVAVAVAALTGAFVAGDSVRASLRDLVLERLGRTTHAIETPAFVREALAEDLAATPRQAPALASRLEAQLAHIGFRTTASAERLRWFSGVTDRRRSAFQTLSTLGLLVGLLGFAAAEFARPRAGGRGPALKVLVEVVWLLCVSVAIGVVAGLLAIAPTLIGPAFYN